MGSEMCIRDRLKGGVDLFVIETMMDLQEARAALIAVKESCDLPVMVSMTYDESKRTLTGSEPVTALITLQSLGADCVGVNCSTGPEKMVDVIKLMKPYAKVPVFAKPNAGLPKIKDGKTYFDLTPKEFASYAKKFIDAGCNIIGGCCGTEPEHIREIKKAVKNKKPKKYIVKNFTAVTSLTKTVIIDNTKPLIVIGERINPTGKEILKNELKNNKYNQIRKLVYEQEKADTDILDINVGIPDIDEKKKMYDVINFILKITSLPLSIDSSSPDVIESALRLYPGKALINSVSGEKKKICLLYTSPSPRDLSTSRMPSSA